MDLSTLIPVHVLTGFLGSGKTTLLNRALQAGFGAETAVIVNELGDVGLDQLFVQARSQETIVLKSGCVCCTIRTDLVSTLLELIAMRDAGEPFRRILIETSGISDPLPILQTLRSDFNLLTRFRAGSIICAVGVVDGMPWEARAEGLAQITAADAIVITKRDLVDDETALAVQTAIVELNPLAEIVPANGAEIVGWLEHHEAHGDDAQRALRLSSLPLAVKTRTHGVRSTVIRAAEPVSWSQFAIWLTRLVFLHGDRILRTKGLLFDRDRDVWIGVHGVRRFFHPPVHLMLPTPPACGACLVFITEGLDPVLIEDSYRRLGQDPSPVDDQRVTRDVSAGVAGEEHHRIGDILRLAEAPQRDPL
jgi:G3E family GTPase